MKKKILLSIGISLSLVVVIVTAVSAAKLMQINQPPPVGAGTGTCAYADCSVDTLNCTAARNYIDDIYIHEVTDVCGPPICNPKTGICTPDTGLYDFMVVINPTSTNLYGIGVWFLTNTISGIPVGTAGNTALDGPQCYKSHLFPVSTENWDFLSGEGPFRALDGDICGDAKSTDGLTHFIVRDVEITCSDELMEGNVSSMVAWHQQSYDCETAPEGVCPGTSSHCYVQTVPFDVTNKPVDLSLTKVTTDEEVIIDESPFEFDYTITVKNELYDDPVDDPDAGDQCYRSSGYTVEDLLPDWLEPVEVVSGFSSTGDSLNIDPTPYCVDEDSNPVTCAYGSIVQIKVQEDLPQVPDVLVGEDLKQPPYSEPVGNNYCTDQYHTITLKVRFGGFDPVNDPVPYNILNTACVLGFQYDPIGVDYNYIDPETGEPYARAFSPNNCDDEIVPLAVQMESFTATSQKHAIVLDWKTVTETQNLGFNIYRSTSEEGLKIKLNLGLIAPYEGYPGSPMGASYQWVDRVIGKDGLRPNTTYYYWVEDVPSSDKDPTLFGPVSGALLLGKK